MGDKKRFKDRQDARNGNLFESYVFSHLPLTSIQRMQSSDRLLHRKPPQPPSPPLVAVSTSFPSLAESNIQPLELTSDPRLDKRSDDYHPLQQQVPTSPSKPGYLLDRVRFPSFSSFLFSPHSTLAHSSFSMRSAGLRRRITFKYE